MRRTPLFIPSVRDITRTHNSHTRREPDGPGLETPLHLPLNFVSTDQCGTIVLSDCEWAILWETQGPTRTRLSLRRHIAKCGSRSSRPFGHMRRHCRERTSPSLRALSKKIFNEAS